MAHYNSLPHTLTFHADNIVNKSVNTANSLPHNLCVQVHNKDSQLVQLSASEINFD